MGHLTLYNVPPSLCSQKVRLVLTEKGAEFTNRWVDIGPTAENYEPWYVKLNPKCVVPTLDHGGKIITNSAVIMRYVAEELDGVRLIPEDADSLRLMERWYELAESLDFRLFTFSNANPRLIRLMLAKKSKKLKKYAEKYPALRSTYEAKLQDIQGLGADATDPATIQEGLERLQMSLDELNGLLEHQSFIAGGQYTLADAIWTVSLTRVEFIKRFELIETRPHLLAYYRRMQARPSYETADLWPRFKVGSMLPIFAKVLGPRLGIAALILAAIAGLVSWM